MAFNISKNIKLAFRNLLRHKVLSTLMIGGLAVGIAASLLLTKYIEYEWSYDRFHQNGEDIVRINNIQTTDGQPSELSALTSAGVAVLAKDQFPEVVSYTRIVPWIAQDVVLRNDDVVLRDQIFYFTDPSFFENLSFKLLAGEASNVLSKPNSIVLTESKAHALFGHLDVLGKTVLFDGRNDFEVTGIAADPPLNSHIQFSALSPIKTMVDWGLDIFGDGSFDYPNVHAYLKLQPNTNLEELSIKLSHQINDLQSDDQIVEAFELQPLHDVHLNSEARYGLGGENIGKNIWILYGISFLVLFLSWINHFNIFTSQVMDQNKSLSIRRIIGANRFGIFIQLMIAALVSSLLAVFIGVLIVEFIRPLISSRFDLPLKSIFLESMALNGPMKFMLGYIIIGTFLTSVIPAIVLSNINPISTLLGRQAHRIRGFSVRKALVGVQFSIIIALLAGGMAIYKQTNFMQDQETGLNMNDIIAIKGPLGFAFEGDDQTTHFQYFYDQLRAYPSIKNIAFSRVLPGDQLTPFEYSSFGDRDVSYQLYRYYITEGFSEIYDLQWLTNHDNIKTSIADKRYAIINQKAMHLLGISDPEDAMGKSIKVYDWDLEIAGVVKDHHQQSLHHPTQPIVFDYAGQQLGSEDGYYSIKLAKGTNFQDIIPVIRDAFHSAFPYASFESIDVQHKYEEQYKSDNHFQTLSFGFTLIGLFIGILGLLGLSLISIKQRLKEVSIRKVLGADWKNIVLLFSKSFINMILIAMPMAYIIAHFAIKNWLENFTYRISVGWWVYVLSGFIALFIVILTIGIQSVKASLRNPSESLHTE